MEIEENISKHGGASAGDMAVPNIRKYAGCSLSSSILKALNAQYYLSSQFSFVSMDEKQKRKNTFCLDRFTLYHSVLK